MYYFQIKFLGLKIHKIIKSININRLTEKM